MKTICRWQLPVTPDVRRTTVVTMIDLTTLSETWWISIGAQRKLGNEDATESNATGCDRNNFRAGCRWGHDTRRDFGALSEGRSGVKASQRAYVMYRCVISGRGPCDHRENRPRQSVRPAAQLQIQQHCEASDVR